MYCNVPYCTVGIVSNLIDQFCSDIWWVWLLYSDLLISFDELFNNELEWAVVIFK